MTIMAKSPPPSSYLTFISCCYVNSTHQIQIGRISNIKGWYLERIIPPGQLLFFEAPSEAKLEIYTGEMMSAVLCDRLACQQLQVEPHSEESL